MYWGDSRAGGKFGSIAAGNAVSRETSPRLLAIRFIIPTSPLSASHSRLGGDLIHSFETKNSN